jgi:hypothetical protein
MAGARSHTGAGRRRLGGGYVTDARQLPWRQCIQQHSHNRLRPDHVKCGAIADLPFCGRVVPLDRQAVANVCIHPTVVGNTKLHLRVKPKLGLCL